MQLSDVPPGDTVLYPLALVCLDLPMAVLLGVDVPELPLLLHHGAPNAMVQHSEAFVTTGAGTRRKAKEDTHDSRERISFLEYDRLVL